MSSGLHMGEKAGKHGKQGQDDQNGLTSEIGAGMMPLVLTSTWDKGGNECCVNIAASTFCPCLFSVT